MSLKKNYLSWLANILPTNFKLPFQLCLLFLFVDIGISVIAYLSLQPQLPIFYSLANPAQQLANKAFIFIYPGLATLMITLHLVLVRLYHDLDPMVLRMFAWASFVLQTLVLLILIRLVIIVG